MNHQFSRTVQEFRTSLAPDEVLSRAKHFFTRHGGIYTAFIEQEGPTHISMRGQGGEELVIGVGATDGGTRVTGSTYLFDQQIARFFTTLPPMPEGPVVPDETAGDETELAGMEGGA
ncbi:MAG TPA: hypothetical protein VGE02_12125 [Gemmatimonadales bacterium]